MKLKSPYSLSFGFCIQPPLQHAQCGDDPQAADRAVLTDYSDEWCNRALESSFLTPAQADISLGPLWCSHQPDSCSLRLLRDSQRGL